MSIEKQIEEIFNDVVKAEVRFHEHCLANHCGGCKYFGDGECDNHIKAEFLYEAGYRKQSEGVTDINVGNKSEWISVDERLPDKEGTYLTYTDKDNVDLDIFCIYPSHGTKFWSGERRGKVTHWMPLPEAPKKDGAE